MKRFADHQQSWVTFPESTCMHRADVCVCVGGGVLLVFCWISPTKSGHFFLVFGRQGKKARSRHKHAGYCQEECKTKQNNNNNNNTKEKKRKKERNEKNEKSS